VQLLHLTQRSMGECRAVELGIDGKTWVAYMALQGGCSATMSMRTREAAICGISFNPFADRQSKACFESIQRLVTEPQFAGFRTVKVSHSRPLRTLRVMRTENRIPRSDSRPGQPAVPLLRCRRSRNQPDTYFPLRNYFHRLANKCFAHN